MGFPSLLPAQEAPSAPVEPESLPGFEPLPPPGIPDLLPMEPCFAPEAPRGSLILLSLPPAREGAEPSPRLLRVGQDAAGVWSWNRVGEANRDGKGGRGALRLLPLREEGPAWTIALGGTGGHPSYLPAGGLRALLPLLPSLRAAPAPRATDLDRDGIPELWYLPPKGASGPLPALPLLVPPPGPPGEEVEILGGGWRDHFSRARQVLPWDLSHDHFEELLVPRAPEPTNLVLNEGDMDLDLASAELQPTLANGDRLVASRICLGPERREIQWALAWTEGEPPRLFYRKGTELAFMEYGHGPEALARLRPRDARIQDLDGDGGEELLLLANPGEGKGGAFLQLFRIPDRPHQDFESPGKPLPVPGGRGILVGDLDQDGAPDLVIPRGKEAPLFLRNTGFAKNRGLSIRLTLQGDEDWEHAIGSYVELISEETRLFRTRWPPLDDRDQPMLWLTWKASETRETPMVLVTWPDGNDQEYPLPTGSYFKARQ